MIDYICPVGTIISFAGENEPESGWFICDGRELSRTEYKRLFDVIGTTYGEGNSVTTFNIPDLRETTLVGINKNETNIFDKDETDPKTGQPGTQYHDVYNLGEFKDDKTKEVKIPIGGGVHGSFSGGGGHIPSSAKNCDYEDVGGAPGGYYSVIAYAGGDYEQYIRNVVFGEGDITHGKQMGINYLIKY